MSIIFDQLTSDYLSQFDRPLSVPAMNKLDQFSFLQQLAYNGQIGYIMKDFHGLDDFVTQMTVYSATNPILTGAWATIKPIAPKNLQVSLKTYEDSDLGRVGLLFLSIPNYAQVFALSPDDLQDPNAIDNKVTISSDQNINLQGS